MGARVAAVAVAAINNQPTVASRLSLAVAGLYALAPNAPTLASGTGVADTWDYQGDVIHYTETDRVMATEANISGTYYLDTDETASFKVTFDTLSGSSPSGQIISPEAQTFTGASGSIQQVSGGALPLQTGYKEVRVAGSGSYNRTLSDHGYSLTGYFSRESDYLSLGFSGGVSMFYNQKNTTLELLVSANVDASDGYFGTPKPLTESLPRNIVALDKMDLQTKNILDFIIGFSQIIDKHSFITALFSFGQSSGYHTDPYKVISVVDNTTALPVPLENFMSTGATYHRTLYERRPDAKSSNSIYIAYKRSVGKGVLDITSRYYQSSWGITSTTADLAVQAYASNTIWVRPFFRYYSQSEADFYQAFITESEFTDIINGQLRNISSDERLAKMTATTIGLEIGFTDPKFTVGLDYYIQDSAEPNSKFGNLSNADIVPDLEAFALRFNFWF